MRFFAVEFKNNVKRSILSYGGRQKYRQQYLFAGIKGCGTDATLPKICVHLHLETDRKYSDRDIFHAISFCGITGN